MTGQILGSYKILEQAGEGNMGAVYHALDLMLDREVALKALRPELARRADVVDRFREEARVQARLNHQNVAQMYALFRHGDDLFMVMEYVQGPTVDTVIREAGRMSLDQALPVFLQALDGVEHAHKAGIIHRDLKPANIMVNRDGLVKVTDFGIARVLGSARMTREGAMIGTLEYMPPERVLGKELDARSDIYSLGFVLYEMLTGNLPFTSQTEYEILKAQIEAPPPPIRIAVPDLPVHVESAILRAMAKNPEERFRSAAEFAAALRLPTVQVPVAVEIPQESPLILAATLPSLSVAEEILPSPEPGVIAAAMPWNIEPAPLPSTVRLPVGETRITDAYVPQPASAPPTSSLLSRGLEVVGRHPQLPVYLLGFGLLVLLVVIVILIATLPPKPAVVAPAPTPARNSTPSPVVAQPPPARSIPTAPGIERPSAATIPNIAHPTVQTAPKKSTKGPDRTQKSLDAEKKRLDDALGITSKPESKQ